MKSVINPCRHCRSTRIVHTFVNSSQAQQFYCRDCGAAANPALSLKVAIDNWNGYMPERKRKARP